MLTGFAEGASRNDSGGSKEQRAWELCRQYIDRRVSGVFFAPLELTKLALRSQRQATTTFDITAQALLFGSEDKYERMTAFLERKPR